MREFDFLALVAFGLLADAGFLEVFLAPRALPAALFRAGVLEEVFFRLEVVAAFLRGLGRVLARVARFEPARPDPSLAAFPEEFCLRFLASPIAAPSAAAPATATRGLSLIAIAAFFAPRPTTTAASAATWPPRFIAFPPPLATRFAPLPTVSRVSPAFATRVLDVCDRGMSIASSSLGNSRVMSSSRFHRAIVWRAAQA